MDNTREIIRQEIAQNRMQSAFGASLVPFHLHTGTDGSPRLQTTVRVNHVLFGTTAQTAANYSVFFTADAALSVLYITEIHTTAGTDAGAVTLNVEHITGTQAPGTGNNLLSTAFNLKGTANTLQTGILLNTAKKQLQKGDRLALVLSGTPTSLTDVLVTIVMNTL